MRFFFLFVLVFTPFALFPWGQTGHRVVGKVASNYLTPIAKQRVNNLLDGESLAAASNWMDDIKSVSRYDSLKPWHYVSIPDGKTYTQSVKNPKGDIVHGVSFCIAELEKGGLEREREQELLKILIHLMGDIHQPLHVGRKEDRGGNTIKVKWFWESSNLHRVWDSGIIDSKQYSYSELVDALYVPSPEEVTKWQNDTIQNWLTESMKLRPSIYDLPEDAELSYSYRYTHWNTLKIQLLKAGVRLAGILNRIYQA